MTVGHRSPHSPPIRPNLKIRQRLLQLCNACVSDVRAVEIEQTVFVTGLGRVKVIFRSLSQSQQSFDTL